MRFKNKEFPEKRINFHRPHPDSNVKKYVLDQVRDILEDIGLLKSEEESDIEIKEEKEIPIKPKKEEKSQIN